jgi:uncharacterized protein
VTLSFTCRPVGPIVCVAAVVIACADDGSGDGGASSASADRPSLSGQVPAGERAAVRFDTATAFLHSDEAVHELRVEIAERGDQRAFGLMDRDELDDDAGMIFLYDEMQPGNSGFWMYRTRIPLDIAFLDGAGRIVAILQMEPCLSPDEARCQAMAAGYAPGTPYFGALEVNRGYFASRGIGVGDRVVLPGRLGGQG